MSLPDDSVKKKIQNIIFETDTPAGKIFDLILIIIILANTVLTIIESVDSYMEYYEAIITALGRFFLLLFALEYFLRILVLKNKKAYLFSFFGIVDLLAILPLFLVFFIPQLRYLVLFRVFRLFRLFSIFKMGRYIEVSGYLIKAVRASRPKITVFLITISFIIVIVGSFMYIIEGPENGFDSIPAAMYWAVVTVSTVGYGDISPQTAAGKMVSSLLMIVGYGIIAVPTGIISHELAMTSKRNKKMKVCVNCGAEYDADDDRYCSKCGMKLS
ncbi:MAG TPA: ion transporter [Halanaerobiales bacterium]|nr:ion transporter [Halanaerobiales bacterium]